MIDQSCYHCQPSRHHHFHNKLMDDVVIVAADATADVLSISEVESTTSTVQNHNVKVQQQQQHEPISSFVATKSSTSALLNTVECMVPSNFTHRYIQNDQCSRPITPTSQRANRNGELPPLSPQSQKRRLLRVQQQQLRVVNSSKNSTRIPSTEMQITLLQFERSKCGLSKLHHNAELTRRAQNHAQILAEHAESQSSSSTVVHHSVNGIEELQQQLQSTIVGENVLCGDSIHALHIQTMMESSKRGGANVNRSNVLSKQFNEIGVGMYQSNSKTTTTNKLYVCQLFRYNSSRE